MDVFRLKICFELSAHGSLASPASFECMPQSNMATIQIHARQFQSTNYVYEKPIHSILLFTLFVPQPSVRQKVATSRSAYLDLPHPFSLSLSPLFL